MNGGLFDYLSDSVDEYRTTDKATIVGISIKTFLLLAISAIVSAIISIVLPKIIEAENFGPFIISMVVGVMLGFIAFFIGRISPEAAKFCSVIYAFSQGVFLGAINCLISNAYPGICTIAICSTFIIFIVVLILFGAGLLQNYNKLHVILLALGIGALALSILSIIFMLFIPSITSYIGIVILIEVFLLIYGVIFLAMNFKEAEVVISRGLPKAYEWSVSLGLLESLIYIYIEIIRLAILLLRIFSDN